MNMMENNKKTFFRKQALDWLEAVIVAFVVAFGFFKPFIFELYKVPTGSMLETIQLGDRVYVSKLSYIIEEPQNGDIVVFRSNIQPVNFVKRVIATPGDTVKIENNDLYIDGVRYYEPYVSSQTLQERISLSNPDISQENLDNALEYEMQATYTINMPEFVVPDKMYLVLGDNRNASFDSRYWGLIEEKQIKGQAKMVLWSKKPNGKLRNDRFFKQLK